MIPVILKGETSKPIQLTLREGYVYSGCVLAVCFRGVMKTFTDLVAGGTVELLYTAEETSTFPLGTGKVGLSIQNSAGDICFMPWAKIKVTDCPEDVRDAQITIDPATLNVEDLTSKDTLASVKSRLNAVMAFLRGLSALAILALPIYALSDVAPLTAPLDDIPGDTPLMTNVVPYVDAKVAAVPEPDYSTGNAQLVATIEATAPAPGNYAAVSNRAMTAIQSHQSLWPAVSASTNYTDRATNAVTSAFLPRSHSNGQDSATVGFDYGPGGLAFVPSELYTTSAYIGNLWIISDDERGPLSAIGQYSGGWKTARDEVEEAIREKSLGGIWDQELGVWWTPVMVNGALTYQATTNVNLNAEVDE